MTATKSVSPTRRRGSESGVVEAVKRLKVECEKNKTIESSSSQQQQPQSLSSMSMITNNNKTPQKRSKRTRDECLT
eukprot:CAMPEP_0118696986 /NCGR_PEP_ID=MMETSP0800-20121206/14202_1 /TAXON_ID=210618 ORGANISM="Striatella unipunctata, Strain CCMP2910" /NCGR_SAMPLE_ID=MMETSP0800 /ASSEMBLY_ACC=CAM_ASM_000638 /LENGTH=75 /DNA_ID=CAMNT_0006596261 /DNA_START=12 /DNA_END=239 /DNA_ORIENTATION=+